MINKEWVAKGMKRRGSRYYPSSLLKRPRKTAGSSVRMLEVLVIVIQNELIWTRFRSVTAHHMNNDQFEAIRIVWTTLRYLCLYYTPLLKLLHTLKSI
jgi:hypothetical protein